MNAQENPVIRLSYLITRRETYTR